MTEEYRWVDFTASYEAEARYSIHLPMAQVAALQAMSPAKRDDWLTEHCGVFDVEFIKDVAWLKNFDDPRFEPGEFQ